ncbi:AsmA family protein [Vibrio lentus]|uniref:AsmA domain-containing protein n=2 Tax=Vibrio lentus TaxID=136468 RepID=A0AA44VWN6_9VIBR|nr:AsmA family protein [Vibrio lentus]MCB5447546.1 AsmA family protein [Vibrio lentus]MCB5464169.1 AsmA family protein [Vibrio lentus]MCC5485696.1 AsmA family protein [Vibrio lentus]MCC5486355.1 AsmA family protein [Vibrio lentus]
MKKVFMVFGIVLAIAVATIAALLLSLQTQYRADVANFFIKHAIEQPVFIEDVEYQAPYHITLMGITQSQPEKQTPLYIDKIDLWFSPDSVLEAKLVLDSVLISGLQLEADDLDTLTSVLTQPNLKLRQLAINNLDFSTADFNARGIDLQISDPTWDDSNSLLPYGKTQLSASQLYWQGEAFDNLLIDLDLKPSDSTLYGASFDWRGAKISGQAEQYKHDWSLVNITIDGLRLNEKQTQSLLSKKWDGAGIQINHINSLDILRSDVEWKSGHLAGFDASLENVQLPFQLWQQQQATFSLQAEGVTIDDDLFVDPSIQLDLQPEQILIEDFYTQWRQGSIQMNGTVTPSSVELAQLDVQGIKWITESQDENLPATRLIPWLTQLQQASIHRLNIERSQLIQLAKKPYWQVSGLHVEGHQVQLLQDRKLGLWQGKLMASANDASYQNILSAQPVVEMNSEQGKWTLTRLFAPLKNGYIEANATLDFNQISKPWSIDISADGLPISPMLQQLELPLDATGYGEFELQAAGLYGDSLMLGYSTTGQLTGSVRQGVMTFNDKLSETSIDNVFEIPELNASFDRGRFTLEPMHIIGASATQEGSKRVQTLNGEVSGELDLLKTKQHTLSISLSDPCHQISGKLDQVEYSEINDCQQKSATPQE